MSMSKEMRGYELTPVAYLFSLALLLFLWPMFFTINAIKLSGIIPKTIQRYRVDAAMKNLDKDKE
jgi:hypothetical protein